MFITICYSILTWIQSRHRQEVLSWLEEFCSGESSSSSSASLVFIRQKLVSQFLLSNNCTNGGESEIRPSSSNNASKTQKTYLCYNHNSVTRTRLVWEDVESEIRVLVVYPLQIVELHEWTAFIGTKIERAGKPKRLLEEDSFEYSSGSPSASKLKCYVLLEAEPGVTRNKSVFKKFGQFGEIIAWKCADEIGLILQSDWKQLVELMHIFRHGQIILEGGWRIYRLTTIACEGTVGTLVSADQINPRRTSLSPGDLRRLSAGIYDSGQCTPCSGASATPTPSKSISQDTSKHDFTKISEETLNDGGAEAEDQVDISKLPNWYERSPKKRSISTIHHSEKPNIVGRRKGSFSSSLSNLSQRSRSSSLASLLMCSRSVSIEESEHIRTTNSIISPVQTPDREYKSFRPQSTSRQLSFDSLSTPDRTNSNNSPAGTLLPVQKGKSMSLSTSLMSSPYKSGAGLNVTRTPCRLGKPPNILILCDDEKVRGDLAGILKRMLANDRYAIYDIRWEQLVVGGWADQTALLIISGKIENKDNIGLLLQYLGDGGRLFAWCCETPPFGIGLPEVDVSGASKNLKLERKVVSYGTSQTHPLALTGTSWGPAKENSLPLKVQRVLETNDSEGYSRPLTATVFAKVKDSDEAIVIGLDGGALGGKAVLSQIHFEETMEEESSRALLSLLLSQNLGVDCTRIKIPEYSIGYMLGDHKAIASFLTQTPPTLKQRDLTLEFVKRGEKGSKASHSLFPIHSLECPVNFSTIDYFNNLETKDLGRLVIYSDVVSSTMDAVTGTALQHGLVVIARQQTSGKGRGKNVWLSPEGCAVFTLQLHMDLVNGPGRRITLLQHIAALAIIMAVPNHKEIGLRVKWPNDVYLNDQKIGGILVESRLEGKNCVVNIGIGVNVCNSYPTISLNSVLSTLKTPEKMKDLSCEAFIARTLTQLEILLERIDKQPLENILNLYEENWIHNSEDEVNVEISEGKFAQCRLNGIDEYGYLRVTEVNSGHVFSVRPDGNSFDIANRLIAIKN